MMIHILMNAPQVVTTLKNTAKPVTGVQFPAVTICGSGFHMSNVEKKIKVNFQKWRNDTGRTWNDVNDTIDANDAIDDKPKSEVSTTADAKFLSRQIPVHNVVMHPLVALPLVVTIRISITITIMITIMMTLVIIMLTTLLEY